MLNQIIQLFCWAPKWLWLGLLTKPQSGSIHVILPFLCAENSTYFNSYKLAKINHFITQWYLGGYTCVDKLAYLQFFSIVIDLSNSFNHTHWCGDICYTGELENKTSDQGSMCFTSGTSNICTIWELNQGHQNRNLTWYHYTDWYAGTLEQLHTFLWMP